MTYPHEVEVAVVFKTSSHRLAHRTKIFLAPLMGQIVSRWGLTDIGVLWDSFKFSVRWGHTIPRRKLS